MKIFDVEAPQIKDANKRYKHAKNVLIHPISEFDVRVVRKLLDIAVEMNVGVISELFSEKYKAIADKEFEPILDAYLKEFKERVGEQKRKIEQSEEVIELPRIFIANNEENTLVRVSLITTVEKGSDEEGYFLLVNRSSEKAYNKVLSDLIIRYTNKEDRDTDFRIIESILI